MRKLTKVNYDVTMEQLSVVKCSLGSIISDESWKSRLRNATKTMTKMRWFGSRAFNDFLLSNVIHGEVDIRTDCSLKNIIRACFTIDTQGPKTKKVPKCFKDLDGSSSLWYTNYRQEFRAGLLDKGGLTNIISHAVNEYHVSVINYITYGLRDHYVQLVKAQYDLPDYISEIIALRILKTFEKMNKGQFSFKLSSNDDFLSKKVRRKETEDLIGVKVEEEEKKYPRLHLPSHLPSDFYITSTPVWII